jgi:ATP-dependent Clp protease ATP-binding subunit ClpA
MSEYQEQRSIGVLLGANLGEGGLLGHYHDVAAGSGVLLLDEIEKAHPLILDLLLQILSAARIKLASGELSGKSRNRCLSYRSSTIQC